MRISQAFTSDEEKELLIKLRGGDKHAVKTWYNHFFSYFYNLTLKKISNTNDAEELVQEMFINALRQLPLFRGESSLKTWMTSILHHEIADFYRKKYAKKALQTILLFEEILQKPLHGSEDVTKLVNSVLSEMKKEYRELLLLKYIDKMRVKEISILLDRTVKSIESDLFRAREEFRVIYLDKI